MLLILKLYCMLFFLLSQLDLPSKLCVATLPACCFFVLMNALDIHKVLSNIIPGFLHHYLFTSLHINGTELHLACID